MWFKHKAPTCSREEYRSVIIQAGVVDKPTLGHEMCVMESYVDGKLVASALYQRGQPTEYRIIGRS